MEGSFWKKKPFNTFVSFVSLIWTLGCTAMTWLWIFILLFVSRWAFSLFIHQTTLSMQGWAGIPVPGHSSCEMLGLDFLCPSCSQILGMNFFHSFPVPKLWEWNYPCTRSELIKDIPAHPPVKEEFWSLIFRCTVSGWQKQSILSNG